ncbi:alpha/beta hydrolase [Corynebacterium sp.]|uniref:alpha/beta hydrolase n=1 Tax=Corynebacterium sp. TaxID=1720 RepID=UPI0037369BD3
MIALPPHPYGDAAAILDDLRQSATDHEATVAKILNHLNAGEFSGEAADAARARFAGLSTNASRIAADATPSIGVLKTADLLEQLSLHIIAALRPFAKPFSPVNIAALGFIADTELDRIDLNLAVAAALTSKNMSVPEPTMDRLYDHPDLTFDELHQRHMATVPAKVAEVVDKHNGRILEAGPGGIAVLVGEVKEDPEAVMTLVAGMGSSASDGLEGYLERGAFMAQEAGAPTVVWLGYTAPGNLLEAAKDTYAAAAGDDLSYFQSALHQRFPDATRTVVGHSYGTVVVSEAAATHGLYADNVVLLGSPGVPVARADELTLFSEEPHLLVADTLNDPIRFTRPGIRAVHGYNPGWSGFGAEIMRLHSAGGHGGHWTSKELWRRVGELNRR